jgi:putative ABC transport system permease protein
MFERFCEQALHGWLRLRRDPALTLAATLTLAVCIAANTSVFSVADAILIRPLPYPAAERIDWVSERSGPSHDDVGTAPDYYFIREQNRVFDEVAAFAQLTVNWTGVERPVQLDAAQVTASFFRVMGSQPMLGRYLAWNEEGPKAPAVAIVSYEFWQGRLAGDRHIVGKTISLDRSPRTIVGVMPQGFDYPRGVQVWLPSGLERVSQSFPISSSSPLFTVSMVARRKAGLAPERVQADMDRMAVGIRAEYKVFQTTGFRSDLALAAVPLQRHLTGDARPPLLLLMCGAGLVLLIACVNLANLLLARWGSRQRELAVRMALGSSRGRLVRQMLGESLMLALPGGLLGTAIAWLAIGALAAARPASLQRFPPITMDLSALGFSIALTLATSLLFGVAPALSVAGRDIQEALKSFSLAHSGGRGAARMRKVLLVGQLGVSLVLVIGGGLLLRSFLNLAHTELGFQTDRLLTFRVDPIGPMNRNYAGFYGEVLDRLQRLPMARSAALLTDIPLSGEDFYQLGRIQVVGHPLVPFRERRRVNHTMVSAAFFDTMQIPLKSGRWFDAHDAVRAAPTASFGFVGAEPVVVNEAFARQILPGENALGQRVTFGPDERKVTWTIVGVVGNVRGGVLGAAPPAMVYRCTCSGSPVFRAGFAIRTAGSPQAAVRAAEEAVRAVDRDQPIFDVKTMDERRARVLAPEGFQLMLIGGFGGIAILLAAAGVYGVMSYLVTRRTREIAVRMAMGARPGEIQRMVLGEAGTLVALAVGIGFGGAWAVTRYIRSMLHGVSEMDMTTFAVAAGLLAVIVVAASLGPARRAVRVDPMTALRTE